MNRYARQQRGMAFILTLAAILIISILLSGALLLSVSHFSLSHTNSSYANALYLAEAGVDWELQKITQSVAAADTTLSPAQALGPGTFQVQVTPKSGPAWAPPDPFYVTAKGTVDGVVRTVRVECSGVSVFGKYALFGINSLDVRGNFTVNGATGLDGTISTKGGPDFNGNFWYHGTASGSDVTPLVSDGYDVYHSSLPEIFPTVNDLATLRAQERWGATGPQTVDFFKAHNNNDLLRTTTGDPVKLKNNSLDLSAFKATPDGVIIFPPGDYYLEGLSLPSNNTIKIDDAGGLVNIWLGPDAGTGPADSINGSMLFTSPPDKIQFHLYDGSARTLKMSGTSDFYGDILTYNGPDKDGQYYGTVDFTGNMQIFGSVIAYDVVKTAGTATITMPSSGGGSGDPILYYGADQWEEINGV